MKETLYRALEEARKSQLRPCKLRDLIDYVLDNTHKTYKYILVTALAAKATDNSINPLCLQAKSSLTGAYDARSICHGAVVKFEMTELGRTLGGSNEPFLNKPARFKELSKENPVRGSRDKKILYRLVDGLKELDDSDEALNGLAYAIQKLLQFKAQKEEQTTIRTSLQSNNAVNLVDYIDKLLVENYEGEILTLVVAGLYELLLKEISEDFRVEVHPVNQSGASSKEISDLDIYRDGHLILTNELKDKYFTDQDVRHAADKVLIAGQSKMNFIVGRHGNWENETVNDCVSEYLGKGIIVNIVPVDYFTRTIINLIGNANLESYMNYIHRAAIDNNFKENTIRYIYDKSRNY